MLILTRRINESIMIGDSIHIKVLGTGGNQVRLGILAPSDISVHRQEIYEKIQREKNLQPLAEKINDEMINKRLNRGQQ